MAGSTRHRGTVAIAAWLFGPAAAWILLALGGLGWTLHHDPASDEVERTASQPAGSHQCRRCHEPQFRTWHRSYHRTMTQRAIGPAVLASFSGEHLDTLGFRATMDRNEAGRPRIRVHRLEDGGPVGPALLDAEVELTVGSHRYQQYVARLDRGGGPQERWRLPVAWHIGEQRWIHLSGAFLLPDGVPGQADDYLAHLSRWNDNCLFCHNTEPSPGLQADGTFQSHWGELGIACEACHGPGSQHVDRHDNPFARLLTALEHPGDPSVAHPGKMNPARGAEVCGRCHGNRIGHDLARILRHGDGFVPGTELAAVSRPIFADSSLASAPGEQPFAPRFWPDGTPRLSAYEYQALLLSPCHDEGRGLSCGDCHTMHGPDPDMQLRADYSPIRTCTSCHRGDALSSGAEHGGHDSVSCTGCHMPRITYGLLQGMMSHRIASPDPGALLGRDDMPDACTQCHLDRSRRWAAEAMAELGLDSSPAGAPAPHESWASRVELDLHGGDPIQRALAAHALGRDDAVGPRHRRMAMLVDGLEDEYPAVRWFAWRALRSLAASDPSVTQTLRTFEVQGEPAGRIEVIDALRAQLGPSALFEHEERRAALQRRRDDALIEIGE